MRRSALVVVLLVLLAACSPAPLAGDDSTTTTSTANPGGGLPVPDPTTTTRPGPTTTVGLYAPKEISFEWMCEQIDRPDAYALSCSSPSEYSTPLEFQLGYWNSIVTFELDENEEPISMTFGAGTYDGNCTWGVDPVGLVTTPIENGVATFDIVMLGTDRCEGLRYVMSGTWDLNTMELTVDGYTEYVDG